MYLRFFTLIWLAFFGLLSVATAGSLKQGCKAIIVVTAHDTKANTNGYADTDYGFLVNEVEMREALMARGCEASDIHILVSDIYNKASVSDAEKINKAAAEKVVRDAYKNNSPKYELSKAGLQSAMNDVYNDLNPKDRIFVLFAGHGSQDGLPLGTDWLRPNDLRQMLRKFDGKFNKDVLKQVVIDACWGGQFISYLAEHRTCAVSSTEASEYSWYTPSGANSFSRFLAEAIKNKSNLLDASKVADMQQDSRNKAQFSNKISSFKYFSNAEIKQMEQTLDSLITRTEDRNCEKTCADRDKCVQTQVIHSCKFICGLESNLLKKFRQEYVEIRRKNDTASTSLTKAKADVERAKHAPSVDVLNSAEKRLKRASDNFDEASSIYWDKVVSLANILNNSPAFILLQNHAGVDRYFKGLIGPNQKCLREKF